MEEIKKIYKTIKNPPVLKVVSPFQKFLQQEALGSKILLACIVIGLIWSNIPRLNDLYNGLFEAQLTFHWGDFIKLDTTTVHFWINDFLMAIFFFVIGLELKREVLIGELSDIKDSLVSIIASIGGMVFPAIIFVIFNHPGHPGVHGWAIPTATDIAITLGIISFFSYKLPRKLKIYLTTMAIVDDIGSIVVVAIYYSINFDYRFFLGALAIIAILVAFNRLGIRNLFFYIIPGLFLWYFILQSGIHATIAGVILAAIIPATKKIDLKEFYEISKKSLTDICTLECDPDEVACYNRILSQIHGLKSTFDNIQSPLHIIQQKLIGFSAFFIVPLFALANSGIAFKDLTGNPFGDTVFWGVFLGLLLGKPIGIFTVMGITSRTKLFKRPENISWYHILGIACLAGIGFTMSSFMAVLSYPPTEYLLYLDYSKIAILLASIFSAVIGTLILRYSIRRMAKKSAQESQQPAENTT